MGVGKDTLAMLHSVLKVIHRHWECSTRDLHHDTASEVVAEERGVESGAHEHQLQVWPLLHKVLQDYEEEVRVEVCRGGSIRVSEWVS